MRVYLLTAAFIVILAATISSGLGGWWLAVVTFVLALIWQRLVRHARQRMAARRNPTP